MHFRFQKLLGIFLVLTFCFSGGGGYTSGQPAQVYAKSQLVKAFVLVQQADLAGASPGQISQLADNLNLALQYQQNSSELSADKSASLSNAIAAEAVGQANTAREQVSFHQGVAYSMAVGAGFASALIVTGSHRIAEFARRLRLRRMRLD